MSILEGETDACFGYVLEENKEAAENQELGLSETFSICLNGETTGNGNCTGEIVGGVGSKFNLTVQPDWVQITSFDRFF